MAQALIFLAPGYEEVEMLTVVDLLRRSKISIDMVSITDSLAVTSSHNVTIQADVLLKDADFDSAQIRLKSSLHRENGFLPSALLRPSTIVLVCITDIRQPAILTLQPH